MKSAFKLLVIGLVCVSLLGVNNVSFAQYSTSPQEDTQWIENIDKKVDKAIDVLTVVREELEKEKAADASAAGTVAATDQTTATVSNWTKTISMFVRIWNKVKGKVEPADTAIAGDPQTEGAWAKDISDKLTKTTAAIKVIQAELKKVETEDSASQTK